MPKLTKRTLLSRTDGRTHPKCRKTSFLKINRRHNIESSKNRANITIIWLVALSFLNYSFSVIVFMFVDGSTHIENTFNSGY